MFTKLPAVIGIYADPNYADSAKLEALLDKVPEKSTVVIPVMSDLDVKIRNEIVLRTTTNKVREWTTNMVDNRALGNSGAEEELLNDHMFLSYLKFFGNRARLYVFPYIYKDDTVSYSSRIQSMIIKAHLLEVPYTVIKEGESDDISKDNATNGTHSKRKPRRRD